MGKKIKSSKDISTLTPNQIENYFIWKKALPKSISIKFPSDKITQANYNSLYRRYLENISKYS